MLLKRQVCRKLGLPINGTNNQLAKRLKNHMKRYRTPPVEFAVKAILIEAIEKAANEATVDHNQEPVRWGNAQGLTHLEDQDRLKTDSKKHTDQIAYLLQKVKKVESLESDMTALKATTESYFAVRSRFFAVFLRDNFHKSSRADRKLIKEDNFAAHGGDPLTDALMFKKSLRTDDKTFELLYGMTWGRVIEYAENPPVLEVLTAHATAVAKGPFPIATLQTELEKLKVSFVKWVEALKEGGYQKDFLHDLQAPETVMYWRFWDQHHTYQDCLSSTKSGVAKSDGSGRIEEE
ncbi:hypothetical protein MMC31_004522 [Peltigera leucophlebia]|nr:hypothetical protein [Peltigera leucophlebia]